jgi:hypothetical protein
MIFEKNVYLQLKCSTSANPSTISHTRNGRSLSWLQRVMPESRLLQELCHLQVFHVTIKSSVIATWTRRNPFITASGCGAKQPSPQSITQDGRASVNERMVDISRCCLEFHTDFPRWPLPIAGAADSIVLSHCKCTVVGTLEDHSTFTPT